MKSKMISRMISSHGHDAHEYQSNKYIVLVCRRISQFLEIPQDIRGLPEACTGTTPVGGVKEDLFVEYFSRSAVGIKITNRSRVLEKAWFR